MPLNSIVAGDVAFGVNLRKNSTRGPIIRKKIERLRKKRFLQYTCKNLEISSQLFLPFNQITLFCVWLNFIKNESYVISYIAPAAPAGIPTKTDMRNAAAIKKRNNSNIMNIIEFIKLHLFIENLL